VNASTPPDIELDAAGNAIATWSSNTGLESAVRYAIRPAGGVFGPATTLDDPAATVAQFPDIAVAPNGLAVIGWRRIIGMKAEAGYSIRPPGGTFSPPQSIAGDPGAANLNSSPEVVLDDTGAGIATWASTGPESTAIRYARLDPGSPSFGPTETIEPGNGNRIAMAPSGAAVMTWVPNGAVEEVRYAFRAPGGPFGPADGIPDPDSPIAVRPAIAPDGSAVLGYTSLASPKSFVRWAAAPPGGPFGGANEMSPPVDQGRLQEIAMSEEGTALALWIDTSAPPAWLMRATLRPPGGAFGPSATLAGPPQGASLFGATAEFDGEGNAAAIWTGNEPNSFESHDVPLLAAGLDAAGPRLSLEVPGRAREDRPASIAMSALDVWSPIASTGIEFGDGKRAPGPTAKHRYRFRKAPYPVTATATDALGNASALTRPLQVVNVKPAISRLRVTPRRFAAASAAGSAKSGATVRFRLSERATVRLAVLRRRGAAASAKRGGFKRIGRIVRRNRRPGANRVRLGTRIRGKRLSAGRYRIVAIAVDPTRKKSRPRKASFSVLPPR
jgi:hypothetical protein